MKFVLHCPTDKLAMHRVLAWHRTCDKVSVSPEQMITQFYDAIGCQYAIYIDCTDPRLHARIPSPTPLPAPPHPIPHPTTPTTL